MTYKTPAPAAPRQDEGVEPDGYLIYDAAGRPFSWQPFDIAEGDHEAGFTSRPLYARPPAASAAAARIAEWQTIATAPVDGKVWVFGGRFDKPTVYLADGSWWRHEAANGSLAVPTHWAPFHIPEPPTLAAPEVQS